MELQIPTMYLTMDFKFNTVLIILLLLLKKDNICDLKYEILWQMYLEYIKTQ